MFFYLGALASSPRLIFPFPQSLEAHGPPLQVSPVLNITTTHRSRRLARSIERYTAHIYAHIHPHTLNDGTLCAGCPELSEVHIHVTRPIEEQHPSSLSCYNYTLTVRARPTPAAHIQACSDFGAAYALEGLTQLVRTGRMPHDTITVVDEPDYKWRGLMLDTGRRFFPLDTVKNLLDTMAGVKLNVLHLHASDFCRFAIESKRFPNLTSSLTGIKAGHYTQDDITEMISYASDRGIRVVPEFDVPGHSGGLLPLSGPGGIQFCESGSRPSSGRGQLYNDPAGKSYQTVHALLEEMSDLFPDEVMHLGCDETSVVGPCTLDSTFEFERKLATAVAVEFGKTPEGWEEIYFDAGAATNDTIVNAWSRHEAPDVTTTGRRAVESHSGNFYFTQAVPGGPDGWHMVYHDIGANVPAAQKSLLLGGEMSMWTDTYCYISQCGFGGSSLPVGSKLFGPERDHEFAASVGGMIWPRGFVGAQAFWHYNASVSPYDNDFVQAIWDVNEQLRARGSLTCPSKCSCDQMSACGQPYLPPTPPPKAGATLSIAPCASPGAASQMWLHATGMTSSPRAQAPLQLFHDTSLCVNVPAACSPSDCYPLRLERCSPGSNQSVWQHDAATSEMRLVVGTAVSNICMDVGTEVVGTYTCGSGDPSSRQPNQRWSYDADTGLVVSTSAPGPGPATYGGQCLTAVDEAKS